MLDIRSGVPRTNDRSTGAGKPLSTVEFLRNRLPSVVKQVQERADKWQKVSSDLDSVWWLSPALPSIERVLWLRYHGVPLTDLSLCVALHEDWERACVWLLEYKRVPSERYDYQTGECDTVDDIRWESDAGREWHERMAKPEMMVLGAGLVAGMIKTDTVFSELFDLREASRTMEDKKSHTKWQNEHPWQGLGTAMQLVLLRACYGIEAMQESYNRAMCMIWWSGEVSS